MEASRQPRTRVRWALYAAVFVVVSAFRFVILDNGFPNDHFVYITGGWQMVMGEWPTRDWVDPGLPLMFLASAVAQMLFGPTLFAEAVLTSAAFGLAAVFTVAAILESTGSVTIALIAGLLEAAILPRTYGYPKVLAYAAAFLCFYRYIDRPDIKRLWLMAATVAIAFLFRHDHGLFVGLGALATVLLVPDASGRMERMRRGALLACAVCVLLLPYVVYVSAYEGVLTYLQFGLDFSRREAARQWHVWPRVFGDDRPLLSSLVYQFHMIPLLALAVLPLFRRDPRFRRFVALVVPVAIVAVAVNVSFIRDPLIARVPDAIAPAVVLGAWLVDRAWRATSYRLVAIPVSAVTMVLFSTSVLDAGDMGEVLDRIGPLSQWSHVRQMFPERSSQLHARFFDQQMPSRAATSLVPFFEYIDRCTTRDQRLLVGGFLPDVPFFAQRRFAAGQEYFGGSFGSDQADRLALSRLPGQAVPLVVVPSDSAEDFERQFPRVAVYVKARYEPLASITVTDEDEIRILVDRQVVPTSRDPATGWPCFVPLSEASAHGVGR